MSDISDIGSQMARKVVKIRQEEQKEYKKWKAIFYYATNYLRPESCSLTP